MTIGLVLDSSQVGSVGVARGGGETTVHRAMRHQVPTHGGAPGRAPNPQASRGGGEPLLWAEVQGDGHGGQLCSRVTLGRRVVCQVVSTA